MAALVGNPADVLALSTLKAATGSNSALPQADPTAAVQRQIAAVSLYSSPAVTEGTVWAIPQERALVVVRSDVTIDVSGDAFFSSDRVGIRGNMRVGFAFPHDAAIVSVSLYA